MSKRGFTLAEVLIALALLGVVAAFTIPKILQSQGRVEAAAKVKEAVGLLENTWYDMKLQGTYYTGSTCTVNGQPTGGSQNCSLYSSLVGKINAVSFGNGLPPQETGCGVQTPGYVVLPNGVTIQGLVGSPGELAIPANLAASGLNNTVICIDVNGASPPNGIGLDAFYGDFNPTGDFDVSQGTVFVPGASNKNFFWGDATRTPYTNDGQNPLPGVNLGNGGSAYSMLMR